MAAPTTLAGIGMAAIGSFPIGGSDDPLVAGVHLFLGGTDVNMVDQIHAGTLVFTDYLEQRDTCEWEHIVRAGDTHLEPGEQVILRQDGANIFKGTIDRTEEGKLSGSDALVTRVEAIDLKGIAERRLITANFSRTATAAGTVITDLVSTFLSGEGLTTNSVQAGPSINATLNAFGPPALTVADAFDLIAQLLGFTWYVDALGDLHFEPRTTSRAPFAIAASYRGALLDLAPTAYWRLGEASGTGAADDSGHGHVGTYSGAPALGAAGLVDLDPNTAAAWDGVDDRLARTGTAGEWTLAPPYTIAALVKTTTATQRCVVSNRATGGSYLGINAGNPFWFENQDTPQAFNPTRTINDGLRHLIVWVRTALKRAIYVDGTLVATGTVIDGAAPSRTTINIGYDPDNPGNDVFPGTLDEVAVWLGRALGAAEAASLWAAAQASFPAPNCLDSVRITRSRERYRNRVTVRYTSALTSSVQRDDTAEQSARAAIEGGTGIYHALVDAPEITPSTNTADANARGDAELRRFASIPVQVRILTRRAGLRAGQLLPVGLLAHGIDGDFLVDQVVLTDLGGQDLRYDVVALSGEHLGGEKAFWARLEA